MKTKFLIFSILISMFSVINISQANANCTAENPCGTWALLDNQGVVTNVIVCQQSVCGGGSFGGQTVVPQLAPNPVTNDTTGTHAYNSSPTQEVRYVGNSTFTVNNEQGLSSFTYEQSIGAIDVLAPSQTIITSDITLDEAPIITNEAQFIVNINSMNAIVEEFEKINVSSLPEAFLKTTFSNEEIKEKFIVKVLMKKIKNQNLKLNKKIKQLSIKK